MGLREILKKKGLHQGFSKEAHPLAIDLREAQTQ
jgi:hypothetical protein